MMIYIYSNDTGQPVASFEGASESECEKWADTNWGQQQVPVVLLFRINREYFPGDEIQSFAVNVATGQGWTLIYNSEILDVQTLPFSIVNRYAAPDPAGDRLQYRGYTVSVPRSVAKKPARSEASREPVNRTRGAALG